MLNIFLAQISDAMGNEYGKPKDITGETRMAFTSHADAAFDVCFENMLTATREPRMQFFQPVLTLISTLKMLS